MGIVFLKKWINIKQGKNFIRYNDKNSEVCWKAWCLLPVCYMVKNNRGKHLTVRSKLAINGWLKLIWMVKRVLILYGM